MFVQCAVFLSWRVLVVFPPKQMAPNKSSKKYISRFFQDSNLFVALHRSNDQQRANEGRKIVVNLNSILISFNHAFL
jgi:hypothetical protein